MSKGILATVSVVITYVLSRLLFASFDFHYNVFSEPFSVLKLVIDFGVWILLFAVVYWLLQRLRGSARG